VARGVIIGLGIFLLIIGLVAYFTPVGDVGYTFPEVHNYCQSGIMDLVNMFGGDRELAESCRLIQMVTYAIYGTGLIGIILIIVGSVKQGKKEDDDHEEKVVAKEETYQDVLKQTFTKEEKPKEEPAKEKPKKDSLLPKEGKKSNKTIVGGSIFAGALFAVIILIFVIDWFPQTEIGNVQDKSVIEQKVKIEPQDQSTQYVKSTSQAPIPASSSPASGCSGNARCFTGQVIRVIDGDTIIVDGQSIRFALASTPELNEPFGIIAKNYVESICPRGSVVKVDEDDGQTQGSYGRIVGVIYCNGVNLNEAILEKGYGDLSSGFCDESEFSGEAWAQEFGCAKKTSESTTQKTSCDPSYPDFCIPPSPPDLDCKDIPQKRFTVIGSDPHRFDGDGDGIGCESG